MQLGHTRVLQENGTAIWIWQSDTLCRLTQIATQTELRTFAYDELSRKISDLNGGRYGWNVDPATIVGARYQEGVYSNGRTYLYDALDRLTNLTFVDTTGSNPGLVYVYDNVGNVLQKTDPNGQITTFTYYDDNRLATVTMAGATFTYVYDLAGRLLTITYPPSSGLVATFGWDNKNRLTSLQYKIGAANFQNFVYTYDDSDNRITLVDTTGVASPINWTFSYDWLNRLLWASRNGTPTGYTYDASDNRVTTTNGANLDTDTCNAGDQLTRRTRGAAFENFLYDRDGNMTSRTLSTGNVTAFKWNDFNQLLSIALNGVVQESEAYDSDGIRRLRSDGTKFYNSRSLVTSEVRPTGAVSFIEGHQLLGLKQGANLFFMISDGLGSVRQVVNSAGVSSAAFESDAYGVQTTATGSADLLANTYAGSLGVRNEVSGGRQLYYARARWYDSSLGRWMSADPVGFSGGLNLYSYVGQNPVRWVDASGLIPINIYILGPNADGLVGPLQTELSQYGKGITVQTGEAPKCSETPPYNKPLPSYNIQITIYADANKTDRTSPGESFPNHRIGLYLPGIEDVYQKDIQDAADNCPKDLLLKGLVNSAVHELGHEFGSGHTPKGTLDIMDPDRNHFGQVQKYNPYISGNIKAVLKWDGSGFPPFPAISPGKSKGE